ncbi:TPA: ABC transporter ATP-binding protein [Stenotrophomonas maltophilia]|uniref:ABC transporter ATP-binding protein n=1 Tax=Stenotrophomonas TaxID=40323 RepID=UPI001AA0B399|nr:MULTISPECIES: ABC transporter ATP-binding protein [Stenotrophomonas]ELF4109264.1 ABC transporter ATP-binding protein [Stenotrophomonas maltophilia]MBO1742587.1 ABC transporter ATP-binding protein [Stenotrophomonas maltophilia]MCU1175504.1 ABC transporter ATP-binding protein [Stenotrophomonas maltophilia]WAP00623.1 ABC transporter ATP-binding protein/permease [Stenotrophomonas sp. SBJS02]HEA4092474.1 ABC transporter ATP-binding protein [Stenotrophomonas maltophilia]
MPAPPTAGAAAAKKPSLRQRFRAMRNLPPFLRMVWQTSPALTLASLGLRLIRALLPVAMLYVGKLIIDSALHLSQHDAGFPPLGEALSSGVLNPLLGLLALEFGLAIASDLLGRLVSYADALLSELFANVTSIRLMEHAATLDLEDFEDPDLQDKLDRARRQTMGRMNLMSQLFGQVQDAITVASLAVGLLVYAPWLILLLALALVPALIGESHFNAAGYSLNFQWTPERRQLDYLRQLGASVETAKEVKIYNLHRFLVERYRRLSVALFQANRALARRRAFWGTLLAALGTLGYYTAYAYIAWRTVRGDFSIGDLTFLAGSFLRLRQLLEGLLIGFSQVASQALYLDDLFSFFQIEPEIHSREDAARVPQPIRQGFVFENVGFRYPDAEQWAVRHLDFQLHAGEVLALVGENGAGKTTLVKLLARLYEPDEGRILLDGRDLRDYDLDDLRANLGVIFQDFVRYNLSAGENIGVGQVEAMDDQARIADAARRGMAEEVIDDLPGGYDQLIGRRFKQGVDLSGGQWQKIAIARAWMRNAQVMILDEPTAALDARSEFEVFQRFRELADNRTAVLISHRFSSVRMADRILVLADGRIEASGTHEQLMAEGGRYAELFELQAAGYR